MAKAPHARNGRITNHDARQSALCRWKQLERRVQTRCRTAHRLSFCAVMWTSLVGCSAMTPDEPKRTTDDSRNANLAPSDDGTHQHPTRPRDPSSTEEEPRDGTTLDGPGVTLDAGGAGNTDGLAEHGIDASALPSPEHSNPADSSDPADTPPSTPPDPPTDPSSPNEAAPRADAPDAGTANAPTRPSPSPLNPMLRCTAGTYRNGNECRVCAEGSFTLDDDATSCTQWTTCVAGQFVTSSGTATRDRTCGACASGTFSTSNNAAACVAFSTCKGGQYVTKEGTNKSDRQCSACASGTFSTATNATSCSAHKTCTAGTYVSQAGTASSDRQCSTCPSGSFSTATNAGSCIDYTTCAAGKYVAESGTTTTNRTCLDCPAGTFSTTTNVNRCTDYTTCGANAVEKTAGTKTTDRVCTCAQGYTSCGGVCTLTASITYYVDSDQDTFGDASRSVVSCDGQPAGYVANSSDCCDIDDRARPDQMGYFASETQCGGHDYDCDGVESRAYTATVFCGGGSGACGCTEGWAGSIPGCGQDGQYSPGGSGCSNFPIRTQVCH